jgi:hypothetical protein
MNEDRATEASEEARAGAPVIMVDSEQWEQLRVALEAEPRPVPALVELFSDKEI